MARYNPDNSDNESNSGRKNYSDQSLTEFNPYYAQFYNQSNQNSKNQNSKDKKSKTGQRSSEGKSLLRRAEGSSVTPFGQNRSETGSSWANNVQGKPFDNPGVKATKVIIKNKRPGLALLVALLLLTGGMIFLSSTHTLLPAALESLITEATDTQYASNTSRIIVLTSYMLQADNITTSSWNGLIRYTKMSSSFKSRLAKNNITIDGSGKNTVLNFKQVDANGVEHITPIKANEFDQVYKDNPDFHNAYNKAKRGRVAGFFDNVAERVMTHLGLSRNVFKDSQTTNDAEANKSNFDEVMHNQADNSNSSADTGGVTEEKIVYQTDENGNPILGADGKPIPQTTLDENGNRVPVTTDEWDKSNAAQSSAKDSIDAETKASNYVSSIASSFQKYTKAANTICLIRKIGNMVAAVASATELYNRVKVASPFLESTSKMKAGYGSSSEINETMPALTNPEESTIEDYSKINSNGESSSIGTITTRKAAVENPILRGVLSGGSSTFSASDGENYSLERIGSALTSALRMGPAELEICNGIRVANALVSIVVTIGTFGVSTIGSLIFNFAVSLSTALIANALLGFLLPTLAKVLFTNTWETVKGEALGPLLVGGIFTANTRLGSSGSGQSPSGENAILAYNKINNEVLALDAKADRLNRSPFDITSKNTFLGSIAYSLLPITLSGSTSAVHTILRTTSKSIASLTSSVRAEGEGSSYITTFGNCPALETLGIKGDVLCNPITTTDDTTINLSPDDVTYVRVIEKQLICDSDGTCHIIDGDKNICVTDPITGVNKCNLARYIKYCSNRDSQFGIIDTNILSEMNTGGVVLNAIPLVGDVIDLINAAEDEENVGWASGQYCVNNPATNGRWNEEMRYYQRFIQDMRLLDLIGEGSNPVSVFLEEYYTKHPLDNSQAGYIARISGISKEDAETLIAIAESYQFLQEYDTSTRIAMIEENTTIQPSDVIIARFESTKLDFSNKSESEITEEVFLAKQSEQYIIYADIRNRSFAV